MEDVDRAAIGEAAMNQVIDTTLAHPAIELVVGDHASLYIVTPTNNYPKCGAPHWGWNVLA
jgi:hypothetical protein